MSQENEKHTSSHTRKRSTWIVDYEVTDFGEPEIYYGLFLTCDPITFENVVK